jgi:hypothetical protein
MANNKTKAETQFEYMQKIATLMKEYSKILKRNVTVTFKEGRAQQVKFYESKLVGGFCTDDNSESKTT